jgi:hypothetical protein
MRSYYKTIKLASSLEQKYSNKKLNIFASPVEYIKTIESTVTLYKVKFTLGLENNILDPNKIEDGDYGALSLAFGTLYIDRAIPTYRGSRIPYYMLDFELERLKNKLDEHHIDYAIYMTK